jgi:hypothetical protein
MPLVVSHLSRPIEPERAKAAPTAEPGRGGAQHKSISHRIKAVAEELGYRATEEKLVLNGQGSVDLALEKGSCSIACEITITTTTDHEFGNVTKCLRAGFGHVAVIATKLERLQEIACAVKGSLPAKESARVGYYSVEEFIAYLKALPREETHEGGRSPPEKLRRGYKVKRSAAKLTPDEEKAREDAAIKMVAEAMKRQC